MQKKDLGMPRGSGQRASEAAVVWVLPEGCWSVGVEFDDFAFVLGDDDVAEGFFDLGGLDRDDLLGRLLAWFRFRYGGAF